MCSTGFKKLVLVNFFIGKLEIEHKKESIHQFQSLCSIFVKQNTKLTADFHNG